MGAIQDFRDGLGMPSKDIWRYLLAEFLGTFILVLVGCGSATEFGGVTPSLVSVAFSFAIVLAILVTTLGHISAHLNPAVTVAFLVTGKIQLVKGFLYILVQIVAGIVAIAVLKLLFPSSDHYQFGLVELQHPITQWQGAGIEFLMSFILIIVIFAVSDANRTALNGCGPLAIGLTLAPLILFAGPLTGAGINPARVIGPSVLLGNFDDQWIYWVGPICGAIAAAVIYEYIFQASKTETSAGNQGMDDARLRTGPRVNYSSI